MIMLIHLALSGAILSIVSKVLYLILCNYTVKELVTSNNCINNLMMNIQ